MNPIKSWCRTICSPNWKGAEVGYAESFSIIFVGQKTSDGFIFPLKIQICPFGPKSAVWIVIAFLLKFKFLYKLLIALVRLKSPVETVFHIYLERVCKSANVPPVFAFTVSFKAKLSIPLFILYNLFPKLVGIVLHVSSITCVVDKVLK